MDDDVVIEPSKSADRPKEDRFELSPIPTTATLPVSNLPNRQTFRPLTAEESDVEEFKSKRNSPYLLRSIDPIPIRPGPQRMNSSSSIISRNGYDGGVPRSAPRSSVDVHMASCSSSPNTSFLYSPRERDRLDEPMTGSVHDSVRGLARRATVSSHSREQEEHEERVRKLSDVLDKSSQSPTDRSTSRPSDRREYPSSRQCSPPGTRDSSPVSPIAGIQSPLLQPPPISGTESRASTAALQAERARAMSLKDSSIRTSPAGVSPTTGRDRDTPVQQQQYTALQYQPRRPSIGSTRGKSTNSMPPPAASGLTRSLRMQESQRA